MWGCPASGRPPAGRMLLQRWRRAVTIYPSPRFPCPALACPIRQDLLAEQGPAYDISLRVFFDLQHTITGWPGEWLGACRGQRCRGRPLRHGAGGSREACAVPAKLQHVPQGTPPLQEASRQGRDRTTRRAVRRQRTRLHPPGAAAAAASPAPRPTGGAVTMAAAWCPASSRRGNRRRRSGWQAAAASACAASTQTRAIALPWPPPAAQVGALHRLRHAPCTALHCRRSPLTAARPDAARRRPAACSLAQACAGAVAAPR